MSTPTPGPSPEAPSTEKKKEGKSSADENPEDTMADNKERSGPAYKVPPKESLKDILAKDAKDPSLKVMKDKLIGETAFPDDPRKVIVKHMEVRIVGEEPIVLDPNAKDKQHFKMKEGAFFTLGLVFYIQHDIVFNLKCVLTVKRLLMTNTEEYVVGSYGPKKEPHSWSALPQEAPSGTLGRGKYSASLVLTDDDKQVHLKLPYDFTIVK
eukprot:gb/GEZN01017320.1/.p1 GENE.gb/GEZN01017320.1/~~gb/GEZN01017320.1/.p1  ORF type:complete len:210 (+),score=37.24 gb/GEZN01017320.1/:79-708(+)